MKMSNVRPTPMFLFWAGFDGTNNIASDPSHSGDAQSTAVGAMREQIAKTHIANDDVFEIRRMG